MTTGDTSYISSTIIDGSQSSSDKGSVVTFENTEGNAAVLKGLTLINGIGYSMTLFRYGGGIYISTGRSSGPTITDVLIHSNTATHGAGIYISHSSPILSNLTIKNNNANQQGGGL